MTAVRQETEGLMRVVVAVTMRLCLSWAQQQHRETLKVRVGSGGGVPRM
jgi:hypothetical protein